MSKLRKWWPSTTIPVDDLLRLLEAGREWHGGPLTEPWVRIQCPVCKRANRRGLVDDASVQIMSSAVSRLWYGTCLVCDTADDLFGWFARTADPPLSSAAAVRALRAHDVRVPELTARPDVLADYDRAKAARQVFRHFTDLMNGRVPGVVNSEVHNLFGLRDRPVVPAGWWTTTAGELDTLLGGHLATSQAKFSAGTDPAALGLAVPAVDTQYHVAEIAFASEVDSRGRPRWVNHRAYGSWPAVYFAATVVPGKQTKPLYVTDHVQTALVCHAKSFHDLGVGGTVVAADFKEHDPAALGRTVNALLPAVRWRADGPTTDARVVWVLNPYSSTAGRGYDLARRLDVPVVTGTETPPAGTPDTAHWLDAVGAAVAAATDFRVASLLADVPWDYKLVEEARQKWPKPVFDKARKTFFQGHVDREVEVTRWLRVRETPAGWVDVATGERLVTAVPVLTKVYRGTDNRVRYRGHVQMTGDGGVNVLYPFDSVRFRKDPAAVIEAAVLRHRTDPPPAPHPKIVRHLADVAVYFYHPA